MMWKVASKMLTIGNKLNNRYELKELIGTGGTAHVYLAYDLFLNREVSVKVLRYDFSQEERALERFHREAKAISEVTHENIVSLYDVDTDGTYHYIVMEYIDGMDLKKYLKQNFPLSLLEIVDLMKQIVSAVKYAHYCGVIHRDLKPQNILVRRDGTVKITDFGIAKGLNEASMTQTNTLVGSIHYLSPEQARGQSATHQSDIYALGIIFYELIMGVVPFSSDSAVSIAMKHFQEPLPSLVKYAKQNVPQSVENIVLKACAKKPENRFVSADEMLIALNRCMDAEVLNEKPFVESVSVDDTVIIAAPLVDNDTQTKQEPKKKKVWLIIWLAVLTLIVTGGIVVISMILNKQPVVTVPNVVNQQQATASKTLVGAGLKIGNITYEPHDTIAEGAVISTDPQADKQVDKNTEVSLVISKGKPTVAMKDYVNVPYTVAYQELVAEGFVVERVEEVSPTASEGQVLKQSISPGTKVVAKGTIIRLTISSQATTVGDYKGQSYDSVADDLRAKGFSVIAREQGSFTVSEGNVISQSIPKGTKVDPKNTTIELVVAKSINVVGLSLENAKNDVTQAGASVVVKEEDSETVEKNVVISQSVDNSLQRPVVTLVVSKGKVNVMPNLIGSSKTFAEEQLLKFNLPIVYVTKPSTTHAKGTVSQQSIPAGTTLKDGQVITITIAD